MSNQNSGNVLTNFSDLLVGAVERAGAATVLVNARRRFPASGIAYADDLILTADHAVEREDDIHVLLADGSQHPARLAGRDPGNDLALLHLDSSLITPAEPAPQQARVGQLALVLGRPTPDGIQASLGIVSAIGGPLRSSRGGLLESYLRTDAIPYPGFSGGPLVDSAGRVLGMNTSGLAGGASLAIPSGLAWRTAESLAAHGSVKRGYLGVRSQPVEISPAQQSAIGRQQSSGLLLVGVEPGSPAEQSGLIVGDILTALEGQPISDPDELVARLYGSRVGHAAAIEILRGGQPVTLQVMIGERPEEDAGRRHGRHRRHP